MAGCRHRWRLTMSLWRSGVLGLALLTVAQITDAAAQTVPVIGYVAAKNVNPKRLEVFNSGLAELGYIDGKNIRIEYREAVLDAEYNGVIADLLDRKIDIILAANVAATRAAAKATKTIPIDRSGSFCSEECDIGHASSRSPPSSCGARSMSSSRTLTSRVR